MPTQTLGDWEREREHRDVLNLLADRLGEMPDCLVANVGTKWAVRPLTVAAFDWFREFLDGTEEVETLANDAVGLFSRKEAYEIVDGLHDSGFKVA